MFNDAEPLNPEQELLDCKQRIAASKGRRPFIPADISDRPASITRPKRKQDKQSAVVFAAQILFGVGLIFRSHPLGMAAIGAALVLGIPLIVRNDEFKHIVLGR